jgi:hypothetical protein
VNPANAGQARRQVHRLLHRGLNGISHKTKSEYRMRAQVVASQIWNRWQVGPYNWKEKHLHWFKETHSSKLSPTTAYRYELAMEAISNLVRRHATHIE